MELTFEKRNNEYYCEFNVTSNFNIHIEKDPGYIYFKQDTSGSGNYADINNLPISFKDRVIDLDFNSQVYPKNILVISKVNPTLALVTLNG